MDYQGQVSEGLFFVGHRRGACSAVFPHMYKPYSRYFSPYDLTKYIYIQLLKRCTGLFLLQSCRIYLHAALDSTKSQMQIETVTVTMG